MSLGVVQRQCLLAGLSLMLTSVSFAALGETRLALVISNASYPAEIGKLENSHKDGAVIAAALEAVGFEKHNIAVLKDADQPTMRLAIADFIERIEKAHSDAVAFLYYSGHGAADRTERGENYLIPIDAKITVAKQLPILGVGLSEITRALERVPAKARFVVVDACRNVAFTKGLKDAAKGFVPERKLDGMIVAFATRPGETAEDNNVYASALASILPTPGLRAEEVFKETQLKVADLTKGAQIPWTEDGLLTRFKFREVASGDASSPRQDQSQSEAERAWGAAKDTTSVAVLEAFITRYNETFYAALARARIEELKKQKLVIATPPRPAPRCDGVEITVGPSERRCFKPGAGNTEQFRDCTTCPEMIVVPAGEFLMGSPSNEEGHLYAESPQHKVRITKPFAMAKFPITRAEFAVFVRDTGYRTDGGCYTKIGNEWTLESDASWHSPGLPQTDRHPVVCINWNDAKAYVMWLSRKIGKTYRLPSETEWEYATRGSTVPTQQPRYYFGNDASDLCKYANGADQSSSFSWKNTKCNDGFAYTAPVGSFMPNPFGLYDMLGNVWNWTEDCWHDGYYGAPMDSSAWASEDCSRRVVRGGSWDDGPPNLRSAYRAMGPSAGGRGSSYGFRVARTL